MSKIDKIYKQYKEFVNKNNYTSTCKEMCIYDHYNDLFLLYPLESSKNLQGFKTSF